MGAASPWWQATSGIVAKVSEVNALINPISRASVEQLSGIDQVNEAISALDHSTQQNTALVGQSTDAASGLQQRAARLNEAINVFKSRAV